MFLRVKPNSEGEDKFLPQVTQIRPLLQPYDQLTTVDLQTNDIVGVIHEHNIHFM